jgi:hypothetical protein
VGTETDDPECTVPLHGRDSDRRGRHAKTARAR